MPRGQNASSTPDSPSSILSSQTEPSQISCFHLSSRSFSDLQMFDQLLLPLTLQCIKRVKVIKIHWNGSPDPRRIKGFKQEVERRRWIAAAPVSVPMFREMKCCRKRKERQKTFSRRADPRGQNSSLNRKVKQLEPDQGLVRILHEHGSAPGSVPSDT